ncbi:MAG: 2-oxoacid:ferredoxin oxidoreductase subunit beta [Thermodesulfobacteriota bacterium]
MPTPEAYDCDFENKWCPGCGNFGIQAAMKSAFAELELPPEKLLIISGIGQAGKTPHFIRCNFFHGLHGRALPVATGAKAANRDLNIVVSTGDGDCYGEGGNHFLAAIRRNIDVTLLVHNNMVYGLTAGQASPTSEKGFVTKLQRHGVKSDPFNPLSLALSQGAGFVARGFAGKKEHLSSLIQAAVGYRGFSVVDIFQPCVSFNHVNTYAWFNERVEEINPASHRSGDWHAAMEKAWPRGERLPIGIFYQKETEPFTDRIESLQQGPLIGRLRDVDHVQSLMTGI